jgi:hypothetical protein
MDSSGKCRFRRVFAPRHTGVERIGDFGLVDIVNSRSNLDLGSMAAMEVSSTHVILENEYATLVYHSKHKIVHHTFHKPLVGTVFKDVLTRGVELFERYRATKWLSDDRSNSALHPDDGKWAMEVWSVRTIKAGWKYWAIVMPDAALGRANMRRFIREYEDRGIEVNIFETANEALEWLKDPSVAVAG